MATRYIYLSDELNKKLKKEENVSQLISKLVKEHYDKVSPKLLTIEQLEAEKNKKVELIAREIEQIEQDKHSIELTQEEEQRRIANYKEKERIKRIGIQKFFQENLSRPLTEAELSEYLEDFERGRTTIWQYLSKIMKKSQTQPILSGTSS